ncbi:LacI family transcriptional regulator [Asanoa ferruginea]|uniref:LacI family transcriptional regulator n=1 Tax=Asanoa ferruginea TaxID=53367 RepID=A0A3D9ZT47_9ACTN|nr:LacI family DNA-binding transcriptional regulator [Asanoa ferruginea]REF99173.1 LacI family transcriptional regulator [Asanoa ferruginea]GIF45764.1 LacI family transcriptional regulator [Asanoa ferruginea]
MAATMHDVARVAGVSVKTVSNVINDYPYVRDATRERVRSAIAALDYRPNLSARGLRSGKTGVIGLAIPELRQNYFAELADAVIRAAERRNVAVLVDQTGATREGEIAVLAGHRLRLTDGLLFSPEQLGQDDIALLQVPFPLVLLGERMFDGPTDHVTMHNVGSARAATEHLLEIGRRRIAVIGAHPTHQDDIRSANLRVRGYREALAAAGIPYDPALVRVAAPWHRENGAAAMRDLLAAGVEFDAVFTFNDTLGLGALRTLGQAGVRVPEDVAVIGLDNIDEARFSVPSMSSVDPGRDQIAEVAVDLLIERINEKGDPAPPRQILADFRVAARESTGFVDPEPGIASAVSPSVLAEPAEGS